MYIRAVSLLLRYGADFTRLGGMMRLMEHRSMSHLFDNLYRVQCKLIPIQGQVPTIVVVNSISTLR